MRKYRFQFFSIITSILLLLISQIVLNNFPFQIPNIKKFIFCSIFIVIYFCFTNFKKNKNLALNLFLTIALFGTVVSIIKPVQFGLDEEAHLKKTIRITNNLLFEKEYEVKEDYDRVLIFDSLRSTEYEGLKDWTKIEHGMNKSSGKAVAINNFALYPAALGWKLGSIFSNKLFVSYYLGRIFNVLAYALLAFIAIRTSRYYKEGIYFFASFPAVIYICAGYHYDCLYFGISLILLGMLTNFMKEKNSVGLKEAVIFIVLTSLLVFSKFPYVLLGSLVVLLPKEQYKNVKIRWWALCLFIGEMIVALLYYISGSVIKVINNVPPLIDTNTPVPKASIFYFLEHPLPIIRTLIDSVSVTLGSFSRPMSYMANPSNFLEIVTTISLVLGIILLSYYSDIPFKWIQKCLFACVLLVICLLVIYAISGDPRVFKLGDLMVGGVQGRYYFFILGILPIFISKPVKYLFDNTNTIQLEKNRLVFFTQIIIAFLNVLTLGIALYSFVPKI